MDYENSWRGHGTLGKIILEVKDRLTLAKGTFIELEGTYETRADALFYLNGACIQFRLALELFAYALIEAHKQSGEDLPKSLDKELWQVAKIMKVLEQRDMHFWPTPVELEIMEDRNHFLRERASTFGPSDLIETHGRLSDALHAKRNDIVGNKLLDNYQVLHEKLERFREYLFQHRYDHKGFPRFVVNMHWGETTAPTLLTLGAKR